MAIILINKKNTLIHTVLEKMSDNYYLLFE